MGVYGDIGNEKREDRTRMRSRQYGGTWRNIGGGVKGRVPGKEERRNERKEGRKDGRK